VIGLTVVAVGTSLREVATSLVSSYRGRDNVAIGNVIGSNLFSILCILGLSPLITPLPISREIRAGDPWWMLAVTLVFFPFLYSGRQIARWEAAPLLSIYSVYLTLLGLPAVV
jgi:cation:H+ antiporter